ncbi:endonuclease domain-containing protein [Methylocapsa sp. S129]|uniref:endonuclease domain-containing protein n=1 Tax=Methylocapsa sp. S129 TaxID=1641869 RepID=UPI00131E620C|nr:endonuclease domain-containing protein [Methylocapsa sp. S129]
MRTRDLPTTARAQTLRAVSTDAECKLWFRLRNRRLNGVKFVRQAPVGPYFADFACRESKLIVELDGSQHADSAHDAKRDAFLLSQGYSVLRFWNADALRAIDSVCETIFAALEGKLEPFERFKTPTPDVGVAPHPALRATFSPQSGEKRLMQQEAET